MKGRLYQEKKTEQVIVLLTPSAREKLDRKVRLYRDRAGKKLSRSEYIERLAKDLL